MAPSKVLAGARVVLPTGIVHDGRVIIDGPVIAGAGAPGTRPAGALGAVPADTPVTDLSGHWVVPGFVDLHNHGGGGASFTSGTAEDVLRTAGRKGRKGTGVDRRALRLR